MGLCSLLLSRAGEEETKGQGAEPTGYGLCMAAALAAGQKDDIALTGVGVGVFEEEKLVDAVVLQRGDLDDGSDGAGEALFEDEVLLATDLCC